MLILVRLEQFSNADSPIFVTLLGIVRLAIRVQSRKTAPPILVTELGIVILVRLLQPINVQLPIFVTFPGITISVKLEQLAKEKAKLVS